MALVAVWLVVLAPTASRTLAAMAPPAHAHGHASMAGMHHHGMRHTEMPAAPQGHDDCDAACGYCTLFAQQPALGGGFFVGHVPPVAGHAIAVARIDASGPATPAIHAPARGPPFVVHA
jgi:hypothetical protein